MPLTAYPGFCEGTYRDPRAAILGIDRCANLVPARLPSTGKNNIALVNVPGKTLASTLATSPGRGTWSGDETRLFCVSGSKWYEVATATGTAQDRGDVGNDNNPVTIFSNGEATGGQLAIISNSKLYVDSGGAASGANAVEITTCPASVAAGGNGVAGGCTVAGYAIVFELNTNNVYISAIKDFTTWDPLDTQIWYGSQDRIMQLIPDGDDRFWVMGRKSGVAWRNVGGTGFPFARVQGSAINTGLAGQYSWALVPDANGSDRICFLSRSDRGGPTVYMFDGYRTVSLTSTAPGIESLIGSYSTYLDCVANGHIRDSHRILSLHFPTALACLCYDFSTGLWHERYSGAPATYTEPVGRFHTAPIVTTSHYWLSGSTGKLYKDDTTIVTEDGIDIYWDRTGPNAHNADHQIFVGSFRLDCELATNIDVSLACSLDNGVNFGSERNRNTGASGKTLTIVEWGRNGSGRSFIPRVRGTGKIKITNAMVDIEDGSGF